MNKQGRGTSPHNRRAAAILCFQVGCLSNVVQNAVRHCVRSHETEQPQVRISECGRTFEFAGSYQLQQFTSEDLVRGFST